jgi:uncharacterized membrane protein YdbT with pleckstrin-like domain
MMSQRAARFLPAGETIEMQVRRHWAVLAGPFLAAAGAIVGAAAFGYVVSPRTGSDFLDWLVSVLAIFFLGRFLYKLWEWYSNRVIVTNHRFVEVSGIITRRVASMPITKITDMTYRRTALGRILGYGDLILETAGQDQAFSSIDYLPNPDDFYREVTALLTQGEPVVVEQPPPSSPEREDTGELPRLPR